MMANISEQNSELEDEDGVSEEQRNLRYLADSLKEGIVTGDREAREFVSEDYNNSSETAETKNPWHEILLTTYSLIPGCLVGFLIVFMTMIVVMVAFFYDVDNLFYLGMFAVLLATCFASIPIALMSQFPGISASVSNSNAVLMGFLIFSLISGNYISYDVAGNDYLEILISMMIVGCSVAFMFFLVGVLRISRIFAFAPEVIFATVQVVIAMMIILITYSLLTNDLTLSWPEFISKVDMAFFQDPKVQYVLAVGIGLAIITSLFSSQLVLPLLLFLNLLGFHLVASGFYQLDIPELISDGWLFPAASNDVQNLFISRLDFESVFAFDVRVLRDNLVDIVVMCFVLLITSLEVNRRLEEAVETYIHPAHEITAASFASVISAFTGGFSVQHSYMPTVLCHRLGARKRSAGLAAAAVCGLMAFFGLKFLYVVPIPLVIATLFNFAILYLVKWLIKGTKNLNIIEYCLVVCALLITFFLGHNAGLVFGLLSGAVVFMLSHSQISGIKRVLNGKLYHSSTERAAEMVRVLDIYGDTIFIIQLEATLVYGMMYEIIHMVVGRNNDSRYNPLGYILLDFSGVRNIDVSVLDQMNGLFDVAEHHNILIVICGLHKQHADMFKRIGFLRLRSNLTIKIMPTLDMSVEWCEEDLIDTLARIDDNMKHFNFDSWLAERLGSEDLAYRLVGYMEEDILQPGEVLLQYHSQSDRLHFIRDGAVDVSVDGTGQEELHLRKLKEGALIGEMGFYLGIKRNIKITALEETHLMSLDRKALVKIAKEEPVLMLSLHRLIVVYLSARIAYVRRMLQVVLSSDTASITTAD